MIKKILEQTNIGKYIFNLNLMHHICYFPGGRVIYQKLYDVNHIINPTTVNSSKNFDHLFCCFTFKSKVMVIMERSVHLTTLFMGKLEQADNQYFVHILSLVTDNNPSRMIQRKGGE